MIHCLSATCSLVLVFSCKHVLIALQSCAVNKFRSTFSAKFVAARDCIVGTAPESSGLFAFSAPFLLYETFFVTIRRKINVANNRMLRQLYELGPLHLSKFYPLPPQGALEALPMIQRVKVRASFHRCKQNLVII